MALEAYQLRILGPLAPATKTAKTPVHAAVVTEEADTAVVADGYFDSAAGRLPKGSLIDVVADVDGTPKRLALVVTANDGADVTVASAFAAPV